MVIKCLKIKVKYYCCIHVCYCSLFPELQRNQLYKKTERKTGFHHQPLKHSNDLRQGQRRNSLPAVRNQGKVKKKADKVAPVDRYLKMNHRYRFPQHETQHVKCHKTILVTPHKTHILLMKPHPGIFRKVYHNSNLFNPLLHDFEV